MMRGEIVPQFSSFVALAMQFTQFKLDSCNASTIGRLSSNLSRIKLPFTRFASDKKVSRLPVVLPSYSTPTIAHIKHKVNTAHTLPSVSSNAHPKHVLLVKQYKETLAHKACLVSHTPLIDKDGETEDLVDRDNPGRKCTNQKTG